MVRKMLFLMFVTYELFLTTFYFNKETADSTKQIYKATGVHTCKVTHHRSAALQYLGFCGLRRDQINTLTKHQLEKQQRNYGSEAEFVVSIQFC